MLLQIYEQNCVCARGILFDVVPSDHIELG
jgi:hypothetical protein